MLGDKNDFSKTILKIRFLLYYIKRAIPSHAKCETSYIINTMNTTIIILYNHIDHIYVLSSTTENQYYYSMPRIIISYTFVFIYCVFFVSLCIFVCIFLMQKMQHEYESLRLCAFSLNPYFDKYNRVHDKIVYNTYYNPTYP